MEAEGNQKIWKTLGKHGYSTQENYAATCSVNTNCHCCLCNKNSTVLSTLKLAKKYNFVNACFSLCISYYKSLYENIYSIFSSLFFTRHDVCIPILSLSLSLSDVTVNSYFSQVLNSAV